MTNLSILSKTYGLVLAGGRSRRMGKDKARLAMPGRADQLTWVSALLASIVEGVFISLSAEQQRELAEVPTGVTIVVDAEREQGPMAGVLAAMEQQPYADWLVVAVDMPLLQSEPLRDLVTSFSVGSVATTFVDSEGRLQPLCACYRAKALPLLRVAYQKGQRSLSQFLQDNTVDVLSVLDSDFLVGANTPEQWQALQDKMSDRAD